MSKDNPTPKRATTNERHRGEDDSWVDQVTGPAPRARPSGTVLTRSTDDSWVDLVADEVQALLREHGLEMELCVWYDAITEHLHAVGYDGSAARYFRSLEADRGPKAQAPGGPGHGLTTEGPRSSQVLTSAP